MTPNNNDLTQSGHGSPMIGSETYVGSKAVTEAEARGQRASGMQNYT